MSGSRNGDKMVIETSSREETLNLGELIGQKVSLGNVITIDGDLGVGKTVLAQGIARGLGITEHVVSPTFTIIQEYTDGRIPLYHFDVYRIEDPDEMYEVGYEEYFYGDGVCVIEWAELIEEMIPGDHIKIKIAKDPAKGFDVRIITIEGIDLPDLQVV